MSFHKFIRAILSMDCRYLTLIPVARIFCDISHLVSRSGLFMTKSFCLFSLVI